MRLLVILPVALAACASPRPPSAVPGPATTEQVIPAGPQTGDEHIVALLDGQPVTWRQVAEHAMEAGSRRLIDEYIYWKLRRNKIRELGITSTPEELRARAGLIVEQARKAQGDEKVQEALKREGLTEQQYVARFAEDPLFAERLAVEKAFVYTLLSEPTVEVDTIAFVDDEDAGAFAAEVRDGTPFARAAEALPRVQTRNRVAQWPRRRLARRFAPSTIAHLEEKLFSMKEGETTGVERTPNNLAIVAHIAKVHPASSAPYAQVRGEIMEEVLHSPPGEEQITMWMDRLFRGSKIHYEDRGSKGNKIR